jgi:hypothetical protein
MSNVKLHDKTFTIYLSEETIQEKVRELAAILNKEYEAGFVPVNEIERPGHHSHWA